MIFEHVSFCRLQRLHTSTGGRKQKGDNYNHDSHMILNMMTVMLLSIMINCFTKVVDDQSGLAGYGSEIDFTDPRLLRNHGPTVRCLDTCLA